MHELKAHTTKYAIKCIVFDILSDIIMFNIMHYIIVDVKEQLNRCDYYLPYVVSN